MRVHHLNCGTMCPLGGPLTTGSDNRLACHCLLIETAERLVLVDTGIGRRDVERPGTSLPWIFRQVAGPRLALEETAWHQVQALGFAPNDVSDILVTHLDIDHAGGLADFPDARIHLLGAEYEAAARSQRRAHRLRYRRVLWDHEPQWVCYEAAGESWFGFESVRDLKGLPAEILLVPLGGHSPGHSGVALDCGDHWLLHAGDAYYAHAEVHGPPYRSPLGLGLFERLSETDGQLMRHNQRRLRQLLQTQGDRVQVVCAHDHGEWARYQTASQLQPR